MPIEPYAPRVLQDVVARVAIQHPNMIDAPTPEVTVWVEGFLQGLDRKSDEELESVALELRGAQLGVLAAELPRISDPDIFDAACRVLLCRPRRSLIDRLWRLLATYCDRPALLALLEQLRGVKPPSESASEFLAILPDRLVNADNVARHLAERYFAGSDAWDDFTSRLERFGPRMSPGEWRESELGRRIVAFIVNIDAAELIRREGSSGIGLWLSSIRAEDVFREFAFGFLDQLEKEDLERFDPALQQIHRRLRTPYIDTATWSAASEQARNTFCLWFNRNWLKASFRDSGQSDRYEFWLQFVEQMEPDRRSTEMVKIFHFPGFTVVEFLEVGYAAYFYAREVFEGIDRLHRWRRNPRLLQDEKKLLPGVPRLLHQGFWHVPWGRRVKDLLKQGLQDSPRP